MKLKRWWAAPLAKFAWPVTIIALINQLPVFLFNPILHMILWSSIFLCLTLFSANIEPLPHKILMP